MAIQSYVDQVERPVTHPRPLNEKDIVDWYPPVLKRTSWGAVFAGVITAMVAQVVLTVLGMAIGLTTADAYLSPKEARGMGIGAGVWWLITGIVSLYAGGWVAGRFAGVRRNADGMLHGFVTWGLTTIISAFMITTAMGGIVGGSIADLQKEMSFTNWTANLKNPTDPVATIITTKGERHELTIEEAEAARKKLAAASWWTFFALLLGAGAATIGGRFGVPHYDSLYRKSGGIRESSIEEIDQYRE